MTVRLTTTQRIRLHRIMDKSRIRALQSVATMQHVQPLLYASAALVGWEAIVSLIVDAISTENAPNMMGQDHRI